MKFEGLEKKRRNQTVTQLSNF